MLIEDIAVRLNKMVNINREDWELILYASLTPYMPKIKINNVEQRSIMHVNMVGEISTAKSTIMKILEKISPKSQRITKMTPASIEGTVTPGNIIIPGVIERAGGGILIIPEYNKKLSRMDIMREAMDCDKIYISKRAITWEFFPNACFIAGSNPKKDFFIKGGIMRNEIPFKEGILSRFDILIPMINTTDDTVKIVESMSFLGKNKNIINLDTLKMKMKHIAVEINAFVKYIKITEEQEEKIKKAYLAHNVEMGDRPRVLLRDLETLLRLINVITAVNAKKEIKKEVYTATDEDIDKAIDLWNYLINIRVQMYNTLENKRLKNTQDLIFEIIKEYGTIQTKELIDLANGICSRATIYRTIEKLEKNGQVVRIDPDTEKSSVKIK